MTQNPVVWFELYVQDMPRARRFYESVFDRTLEPLDSPGLEMWAFPMDQQSGGATGALVKMDGMASGGNSTLVYFTCDDCAVETQRAVAAGGRVFREKRSIGEHGFIALIVDTEGNRIGLHSMR